MKEIIALLVTLILLGGIVMPANAYPKKLVLEGLPGTEIYINGEMIGDIPENGTYILMLDHPVNLSFEKEGYIPVTASEYVTDLPYDILEEGCFTYHIPLQPIPIPKPTPTPTPEDFKTHDQRIEELENQTAEQEERLNWLETQLQKIIAFLKTIGFKSDE